MDINFEFILYVSDQKISRDFYSYVLNLAPSLDVEGMTEYILSDRTKLGLMPASGIKKIFCKSNQDTMGNKSKWEDQEKRSRLMLEEAKIEVIFYGT